MSRERRDGGFPLVYAIANAGSVLAYAPLLGLLLPLRVASMGVERVRFLAILALVGAIAASVANIGWGEASDRGIARGGTRRGWIGAGLVATLFSYVGLAAAGSPTAILIAVIGFQIAVNLLLSPLFALAADRVGDAQKGMIGGLIMAGAPVASLIGGLVLEIGSGEFAVRLAVVGALVVAFSLPLLVRARSLPPVPVDDGPVEKATARRQFGLAWISRLLVQIAGNVVFTYQLLLFEGAAQSSGETIAPSVGLITGLALGAGAGVAVAVGRWSDRSGRRRPFLLVSGVGCVAALTGLALAQSWWGEIAAFVGFCIAQSVFLGLNAAMALQSLPSPRHRGRDLGIYNLSNTFPALLGPGLVLLTASGGRIDRTLVLLAALTLVGVLPMLGRERGLTTGR